MGLEDRDWCRDETPADSRRRPLPGTLLLAALVGGLILAGAALAVIGGNGTVSEGESRKLLGDTNLTLLPGLPSVALRRDSLYGPDDRWTAYLADEATCPGGERTDLPLTEQANAMVCLVNYARRKRGLGPLAPASFLNASSLAKAERITRCSEFAHGACGEDPVADARAAGYRGAFGENLYLADGRLRAPRVALDGWLNSPGHRTNLFRPEWRVQGIAVRTIDRFGQYRNASLWVNQFGTG